MLIRLIVALAIVLLSLTLGWARTSAAPATSSPLATHFEEAKTIPSTYFRIKIVDEKTGRGIPMVKARLTNSTEYWTDSAGVIAFEEVDLWGYEVELTLETYGYHYPKRDMFGSPTVRFTPTRGGSATFAMVRDNIAERLYRSTGSGIYRDSILLGDKVPATEDTARQHIMWCDGSQAVLYRGKLLWVRGDTGISATGLGNFKSTGAWVDPPGRGGLDPEVGIAFTYVRNAEGRPRAMIQTDHQGPVWMGGMRVVRGKDGREHLFGDYMKVGGGLKHDAKGLLEYNDATDQFEMIREYPWDGGIAPEGVPFLARENGREYYYQGVSSAPAVRCPADAESIRDIASYEAFTCLKEGSRFNGKAEQLDRDRHGNLRWGWKRNTSPITQKEQGELLKKRLLGGSLIQPEEAWFRLTDVGSTKTLSTQSGTIHWNDYRKRYVSIQEENFGDSWLGEVWYFEGDTPLGPWVYGTKILTHALRDEKKKEGKRVDEEMSNQKNRDSRSFYCVSHHPMLDKDGGRVIFFEGTVSMQFSDAVAAIPRYDYNNMVYKLDLSDPRLFLPVAVCRVEGKQTGYYTKAQLPAKAKVGEVAFFAPDRPREGTEPVYAVRDEKGRVRLTMEKPTDAGTAGETVPAFFAVGAGADLSSTPTLSVTVPLHEFVKQGSGERLYSTRDKLEDPKFERQSQPVCRVWPNPIRFNPYAVATREDD